MSGARTGAVYYRLVDIELISASFGDTLWELEVALGTLDDIWYSAGDHFAQDRPQGLHRHLGPGSRIGALWYADLADRTRLRILSITCSSMRTNQRVIVVEQNNMALIEARASGCRSAMY